jgi:galactokinase
LPIGVQLGITVDATLRTDGALVVQSAQVAEPPQRLTLSALAPNARGWTAYVEGAAWVLSRHGLRLPGADVFVDGDLPMAAGLSSSAALTCAALSTFLDLEGQAWAPERVAAAEREVENEYVGAPVGVMDPMVVMLAERGRALFLDTLSLATEQMPLGLAAAGLSLLVVDTGSAHRTAGPGYAERVNQCRDAASALGVASLREVPSSADVDAITDPVVRARARHVVSENDRVLQTVQLLREDRVADIGPLMTASHASLRDNFEVSTPALDLVVRTALAAGALGARLTGAGFGGSAVALVPSRGVVDVTATVIRELAASGVTHPHVLEIYPSRGAHRVDRPQR